MTRSQAVAVGVVIVVLGGLGIWWTVRPADQPSRFCRALAPRVAGLDSFDWSSDDTSVEASWGPVLGEGVTEAARRERPRLAAAVRGDEDGYHRLLDAASGELRPALRRMHTLIVDPEASWTHRHDRQTDRDSGAIARAGARICNVA